MSQQRHLGQLSIRMGRVWDEGRTPRLLRAMSTVLLAAVVALLVAAGPGPSAWADATMPLVGEALEQRVREISEELRCPTCQAISVRDSEAGFSRQIRDKVRELLQAGQNEEQIKAFFVEAYGEWILRAPKKQGVGLILWILPGAAMVLFGVWIGVRVYGNTKRTRLAAASVTASTGPGSHGQGAPSELSTADKDRLARDLARFEAGD